MDQLTLELAKIKSKAKVGLFFHTKILDTRGDSLLWPKEKDGLDIPEIQGWDCNAPITGKHVNQTCTICCLRFGSESCAVIGTCGHH